MSTTATAARPCGARKTKNGGQKKQPQRGLGVAQLEKLRLQEQQQQQQCREFDFAFPGPLGVIDRGNQVLDRSFGGLFPPPPPLPQWPLLPLQQQQQQGFQRAAALVSQIDKNVVVLPGSRAFLPSFSSVNRAAAAAGGTSYDHRSPSPAFPRQEQQQQHQMDFAVQQLGTDPVLESNSRELSSFQTDLHQQQQRTSDDKTRKRPRLELWLRPNNISPSNGSNPGGVTHSNALGSPEMLATLMGKIDHQTDKIGYPKNDSASGAVSCSTVSSSPVDSEKTAIVAGTLTDVEIESAATSDFLTLGLANSPRRSIQAEADDESDLKLKQQKDGTWLNLIRIGGKAADGFTDGVSVDLDLRLSM